MKTTVIVEYTKEDKALLDRPLPPNPCDTCKKCTNFRGCPESQKYDEAVQPYRDAGIYAIARTIEKMRKLEQQARDIAREYNELGSEIPDFANHHTLIVQTRWRNQSKES